MALQVPCLDPLDLLHLHLLLVGGGLDAHLDEGARVVFHGQWQLAIIRLIGASPHTGYRGNANEAVVFVYIMISSF